LAKRRSNSPPVYPLAPTTAMRFFEEDMGIMVPLEGRVC
jgi:hypothetical protein